MTDDLQNAIATINELRATVRQLNAIIDRQAADIERMRCALDAVPVNALRRQYSDFMLTKIYELDAIAVDAWLRTLEDK